MAVVEGYKHNEIAAQLNISVAASKTLLHRARKQLQQRITLNDHHYEKQPS
jgi:DNA-directed RNA polymerase specialized sigma24 family protein